jgi:hypothetical protein
MTALVLFTLLGFVLALVMGGTLAGWRTARVRWWLPALGALGLQLFLYNPPIPPIDSQPWALAYGPWLFVLAKAVMTCALLGNAIGAESTAYRSAWLIAAIGVGFNLAVVAANGGYMPQSEAARVSARGTRHHPARRRDDPTPAQRQTDRQRDAARISG